MPNEKAKIKMLTLEEANALLPKVRLTLKSLREQRSVVLRTQAQIEIEEMTGTNSKEQLSPAAQAAITKLMEAFHYQTRQFEDKLEDLFQLGAHLKDLDTGLVDFYSRRGQEVVFLCWKEGEAEIRHWHSLQGGFQSRKPLL
jgi:hypothetical protein